MSSEFDVPGVLDTNVLVYAHLKQAEHHGESAILLDLARTDRYRLAITPQVLMEFYAVITEARRVTTPYTSQEALFAIDRLLAMPGIFVLPFPDDLIDRTQELLQRRPVTGAAVYDVQIVATMLGNGMNKIYTYDRKGFASFVEIQVETPLSRSKPSID